MLSLCSLIVCVLSVCSLSMLTVSLYSVYAHWQFTLSVCSLTKHICGVMVSMLALSAVDCVFESWSGQTKNYKIGICCFSTKHAAFRRKSKDWLDQNQDNVSESGNMSIRRLLFQWTSTIKIQLSVLVYYKADLIIIILLKIAELVLSDNHSFTQSVHWVCSQSVNT